MGIVVGVALAGNGPSRADAPPQCSPPTGTSKTFAYSSRPQEFGVPEGVRSVTVSLRGGHGGFGFHTAHGGAAAGVDATVAVVPRECLIVHTGGYGGYGGGFGWGKGGRQGVEPGPTSGFSGAGGGGASALVRGVEPLVVAAGGGGGGGDSSNASRGGGGNGGDGGINPNRGDRGHPAGGDRGGAGGCGGCQRSPDGAAGQTDRDLGPLQAEGAGGGGGGGLSGGGGGKVGVTPPSFDIAGGGGGGGAGASGAPGAGVTGASVHPSTAPCPYNGRGSHPSGCYGSVTVSWASDGGLVPLAPVARPLSLDISRARNRGIPVRLAPVSSPVVLELTLRGRTIASLTAPPQPAQASRVVLRLTAAGRRALSGLQRVYPRLRVQPTGQRSQVTTLELD